MFRKIDKTSTFNDVLKQIIENIQNGELQPGDALPAERILAEEFGISRPALDVYKRQSLLDAESRFPVGSSARITGGWAAIALAIATLCCCPPDISFGL